MPDKIIEFVILKEGKGKQILSWKLKYVLTNNSINACKFVLYVVLLSLRQPSKTCKSQTSCYVACANPIEYPIYWQQPKFSPKSIVLKSVDNENEDW